MSDEMTNTEDTKMDDSTQAAVTQGADAGRDDDGRGRGKGRAFFHKRVCRFCANKTKIDYKDADALRRFTTERGKICPAASPAPAPSTRGSLPAQSRGRGPSASCPTSPTKGRSSGGHRPVRGRQSGTARGRLPASLAV